MVEQRTENPCVPGSIPGGGTQRAPEEGAFALTGAIALVAPALYAWRRRTGFMLYYSQAGYQAGQGRVPAISRRKPSAFLMGSIHKYKALSNDSVVDYRKVLAQMDKLTEGDESNGRINSNDVRIDVSKNRDDVRINVRLSDENQGPSAGTEDSVHSRKKHLIEFLKANPEATVEKL